MSDPIARNRAELADVLDRARQAAEQETAWRGEKESLVRQAKALGASLRQIGDQVDMTHPGVGKLIARTTPAGRRRTDVG